METPPAVINNLAAHRFEVEVDGHLAFAEYRLEGDRITFTHTLVPQALGGKGLGGLLAKTALDYAAAQGLKVVPRCSFIAGYIARHPQFAPLVDSRSDAA